MPRFLNRVYTCTGSPEAPNAPCVAHSSADPVLKSRCRDQLDREKPRLTRSLPRFVQFQNDLIPAVGAPINFKIASLPDRAMKMKMGASRVIRFNRRHFHRLGAMGSTP
jgi:hypothetical protein